MPGAIELVELFSVVSAQMWIRGKNMELFCGMGYKDDDNHDNTLYMATTVINCNEMLLTANKQRGCIQNPL